MIYATDWNADTIKFWSEDDDAMKQKIKELMDRGYKVSIHVTKNPDLTYQISAVAQRKPQ